MDALAHFLPIALLLSVGVIVWTWHIRRHPWMPCGKCTGSGNVRHLKFKPFGNCSRCGGKGKRLRITARLAGYNLDSGKKGR